MSDSKIPRRRFVRNTVATTMSISFTGLIRAHGGGGGGDTTTWDPNGTTMNTTINTTWDPNGTTWETTHDTTYDTTHETTVPSKPKNRMYFIKIWVKEYDYSTDPATVIFTTDETKAILHSDATQLANPTITGGPNGDGGSGNLQVEGIDLQLLAGLDISTTESHTDIILDNQYLTPNPKITFDTVKVNDQGIERYQKFFDVQVSYTWVYPSSP